MEKFLYFGKNPTNIMFRGVSFPVYNGDVMLCEEEFIKASLTNGLFRKVRPDDANQEPKFTFKVKNTNVFANLGATLPVTSDPSFRRKPKPAQLSMETQNVWVDPLKNENSLVEDKVVLSTALPHLGEPKEELKVEVEETKKEQKEEVTTPTPETQEPEAPTSKTALRSETVAELKERFAGVLTAEAPSKPEMLAKFKELNLEEATKGEVFPILWEYYGFDQE